MPSAAAWVKMLTLGTGICIGGPLLVNYLRPSEEELFKRFNPDLQRRNLENRERRQQEFDDFVTKLKEYSKSDKPIWEVMREEEERKKKEQQIKRSQS
ncbi:hypothetical protein VTO42DRAFT_7825 [Malbranchea cinnamomea]